MAQHLKPPDTIPGYLIGEPICVLTAPALIYLFANELGKVKNDGSGTQAPATDVKTTLSFWLWI